MRSLALALLFSTSAAAAPVSFKDPKGDDFGPGTYTYPTNAAYKKGSFDLVEFEVKEKGADLELTFTVAAPIEDPWDSAKWPTPGNGFSLQMFHVYVDVDGKPGSGEQNALPGMNATFADDARWEKAIIVSPQANKEILSRVDQKAKAAKDKIILPKKVTAKGKKVTAIIAKADLGVDPAKAGWQVLVASNEGFDKEANNGILTRVVNEFEGDHRFGGGDDSDVDPNFVDALAGKGAGGDDEIALQKTMLKYDAKAKKKAVLGVVKSSG
jgi:carbohydrate-binding DOMON domain-containing protein